MHSLSVNQGHGGSETYPRNTGIHLEMLSLYLEFLNFCNAAFWQRQLLICQLLTTSIVQYEFELNWAWGSNSHWFTGCHTHIELNQSNYQHDFQMLEETRKSRGMNTDIERTCTKTPHSQTLELWGGNMVKADLLRHDLLSTHNSVFS